MEVDTRENKELLGRRQKNRLLRTGSLLLIPLAVVALSRILLSIQGPYYLGPNFDPDYCYLFNSLSILKFHMPGHTDHPGTTLQVFGAAVVFCKWALSALTGKSAPIQYAVLAHPEEYLRAINFALNLLIGSTIFLVGMVMDRVSGSLPAAYVMQLSVGMFSQTCLALTRVSPEPLLVAAGFVMIALLLPRLIARDLAPLKPPISGTVVTGAVFGFGLVTKLTFLPLVTLGALFHGWKQKLVFLAAAVASTLVFLLPIFPKIPAVLTWFGAILTHSEKYGAGPVGLPPFSQLLAKSQELLETEPFIFLLLAYYVLVLLVLQFGALQFGVREKNQHLIWPVKQLLVVGLISILVEFAATVKHFAPQYIIPSLIVAALLNSFLTLLFLSPALPKVLRITFGLAGIALLLGGLANTAVCLHKWTATEHQYAYFLTQIDAKKQEAGNCITIPYYRSSIPAFALVFGHEYSAGVHRKELKELYPDLSAYNRFGGGFMSFNSELTLPAVRHLLSEGRCILMQGTPVKDWYLDLPPGLTLEPVIVTDKEALYRLQQIRVPAP